MSFTTITINSVNYTSYATVAEADAYLAVDPTRSAAWAALTDDQKGANLVAATRRLDLLDWSGEKLNATQENEWPRTGVTCDGDPLADMSDVPQQVENATILKAGSIALDASQANVGTSGSNIRRVQAGSAQVEFFRPTIPGVATQDETVFALVRCLLAGNAAEGGLFGAATGTTGDNACSTFTDRDFPGLSEGYP